MVIKQSSNKTRGLFFACIHQLFCRAAYPSHKTTGNVSPSETETTSKKYENYVAHVIEINAKILHNVKSKNTPELHDNIYHVKFNTQE